MQITNYNNEILNLKLKIWKFKYVNLDLQLQSLHLM